MTDPTPRYFTSNGLRLHYVDWGNGDSPLLLLVHGTRDHSRSWDWVARRLQQSWHVVCVDLRGHGDSDWSPDGDYDRLTLVNDLAEFVYLLGDPPVTIVAHSLGANIALRYAGLFPERTRKLVAIEGLGFSPDKLAERMAIPFVEHWRRWIAAKRAAQGRLQKRYSTIEDAIARMRAANHSLSADRAAHLTVHGTRRNDDGTW
ncbi:MAG TPA: alpha/beta hydrolase, partial [Sphingomonas sp.]|nr:alpha/beta hydrolase [Sphingomonas sp.]